MEIGKKRLGGKVDTAALPIAGKAASDGDGVATRPRRSMQLLERSQESALAALAAIASYLDSDDDLPVFFERLNATVAELTGPRRAAFWRLGARGTLGLQPAPSAFADDSTV